MYLFEFDPHKSASNMQKHGIDFEEAKRLWQDPRMIEVSARSVDEQRALVVGLIDNKHWSAVITYRDRNIRIISVRRSRESEVAIYES